MNNIVHIIAFFLFSGLGCGVTDQEIPEFESYFKAEINGKAWQGDSPRAAYTFIEKDTLFQVFDSKYDSLLYPYQENIGFSLYVTHNKENYPVIRESGKHGKRTGGSYLELDGDAIIARYNPVESSINSFNIKFETDEYERPYVEGTFALKAVVDPDYDTPHNNQYRQQPDTVFITNGEYRILLEE